MLTRSSTCSSCKVSVLTSALSWYLGRDFDRAILLFFWRGQMWRKGDDRGRKEEVKNKEKRVARWCEGDRMQEEEEMRTGERRRTLL